MKCIITERIIPGPGINEAAIRIAYLDGEPPPRVTRAVRYHNTETSEEYLALAGGFAWPGMKPGFAVVIAVMENEDYSPFQSACRGRGMGSGGTDQGLL